MWPLVLAELPGSPTWYNWRQAAIGDRNRLSISAPMPSRAIGTAKSQTSAAAEPG